MNLFRLSPPERCAAAIPAVMKNSMKVIIGFNLDTMKNDFTPVYVAPTCKIFRTQVQGVLCQSIPGAPEGFDESLFDF